ncbi:MAG: hypothetical protein HY602_00275 [Parcubacteria group bacterium]|nr:hypothetical protein [Parcubacteria group bacterium]
MSFQLELVKSEGRDFSLTERDFFDKLKRDIARQEKNIPWRQRKQYKIQVYQKEQEYVLKLIDVKTNAEIAYLEMHKSADLQGLETRLLLELAKYKERMCMQTAIDVQKDFRDAQTLAKKIDPSDEEFNEEYLRDLRNVALGNIKEIGKIKERGT